MKFVLIIGFASMLTLFLAGSGSPTATQDLNSPSNNSEPILAISSPTPEITETISSTNSITCETGIREIFEI